MGAVAASRERATGGPVAALPRPCVTSKDRGTLFQLNVPSGRIGFQLFQTDVMGITSASTILCDPIKGRVRLNDAERQTLAEISQKLGRKTLEDVAHVVKPDIDCVN